VKGITSNWKRDLIRISFEEANSDQGMKIRFKKSPLNSSEYGPSFSFWAANSRYSAYCTDILGEDAISVHLVDLNLDQRWIWKTVWRPSLNYLNPLDADKI
jgi:hypothetical protein